MTPEYIPPTPKPRNLFELAFDNDEYYVPLGLFRSEEAAKRAWALLSPKLNADFRDDYMVRPAVLYEGTPDNDVFDVWLGEIGDHNEDATAFTELDDQGEELEEPEESPPPVAPGQEALPL